MYKTVRKGDASLQYTILPQTDQFNATGFPLVSSSKARPRALKFTMALVLLLIILSCIATPFLMNQKDHNLFASTMLSMGRVEHSLYKNATNANSKDVVIEKEREVEHEKLGAEVERRDRAETTSSKPDDHPVKNLPRTSVPTTTSSSPSPVTTSATNQQQTSSVFSTTLRSSTTQSINKLSTDGPRKLPRVTLKLRENETVPQMYMKAGIASYKKGNITTSVLAHGLSLEGLIFKTPEGTIKPWPQKWPFADPSYFQWKGIRQVPRMVTFVLAGLLSLATISVILLTYIQWKASRRQRGNVEVHEIESQEEDESTLLGPETSETVEKE